MSGEAMKGGGELRPGRASKTGRTVASGKKLANGELKRLVMMSFEGKEEEVQAEEIERRVVAMCPVTTRKSVGASLRQMRRAGVLVVTKRKFIGRVWRNWYRQK